MDALQQMKQQELNLHDEPGRNPDRSSEAYVASHLSVPRSAVTTRLGRLRNRNKPDRTGPAHGIDP